MLRADGAIPRHSRAGGNPGEAHKLYTNVCRMFLSRRNAAKYNITRILERPIAEQPLICRGFNKPGVPKRVNFVLKNRVRAQSQYSAALATRSARTWEIPTKSAGLPAARRPPIRAAPGPPQATRGNCLRFHPHTLLIATYAEPTVYKAPFRSHLLYSPIVRCICPRAGIHRGDRAMSFLVIRRASSDRRPRRAR